VRTHRSARRRIGQAQHLLGERVERVGAALLGGALVVGGGTRAQRLEREPQPMPGHAVEPALDARAVRRVDDVEEPLGPLRPVRALELRGVVRGGPRVQGAGEPARVDAAGHVEDALLLLGRLERRPHRGGGLCRDLAEHVHVLEAHLAVHGGVAHAGHRAERLRPSLLDDGGPPALARRPASPGREGGVARRAPRARLLLGQQQRGPRGGERGDRLVQGGDGGAPPRRRPLRRRRRRGHRVAGDLAQGAAEPVVDRALAQPVHRSPFVRMYES